MIRLLLAPLLAILLAYSVMDAAEAREASSQRRTTADDMTRQVLQRDLAEFLQMLEGRFDNEQQVFFDADLKTPAEVRTPRIHAVFRKVTLPALGEFVYVFAQFDGATMRRLEESIALFSIDAAEAAIKQLTYRPRSAGRFDNAARDPSVLAGVGLADVETTPGCEILWKRDGEQFRGAMKAGACPAGGVRDPRKQQRADTHLLSRNAFWMHPRIVDERGGLVSGNPNGTPHKLTRVRSFSCWMFVLRGARHGDSGEGAPDWQVLRDIWVHDQGGIAAARTDEIPARTVRLRLRDVVWPFGANRPSLTLYVLDGDNDRAVSYAWTGGGASRVGVNLRWMQASCSAAPERLWDGGW